MRMKLGLVIVLLFLTSCGDDNFPEYVYLNSLRVVSVVSSQPEASPSSIVTLTPWISDVTGGGRQLAYTAKGCMDPGIGSGADISCEGKEDGLNVAGNISMSGPEFTGVGPTLTVTIPATALNGRSTAEQLNGVNYIVLFTVTAPDGKSVQTLKRIAVSSLLKQPKNANPAFNQIETGGVALSSLPTSLATLKANVTAASAERYTALSAELKVETRTEEIYTTWFVTDGTLSRYRSALSGSVDWTPPTTRPTSRKVTVLAVTRDGRGGESVVMKSF